MSIDNLSIGINKLTDYAKLCRLTVNILDILVIFSINGSPTDVGRSLLRSQHTKLLTILFCFHKGTSGCSLCSIKFLAIEFQHRIGTIVRETFLCVTLHEGINSIHTINRSIPTLCAFALQQPALHLADSLFVIGSNGFQRLYDSHLCRYAIVKP